MMIISCSYYASCRDSITELGMELAMRLGPLTCDHAQALNWAIIYCRHHIPRNAMLKALGNLHLCAPY